MSRFIKKYMSLIFVLFVYLPCFGQYTKTLGSNEPVPNGEGRIIEVYDTYSGEIKGFNIGFTNGEMNFYIISKNNLYLSSISMKTRNGTTILINGNDYSSDIFKVIVPPKVIYKSEEYNVTLIEEKVFETKNVSTVELPNTLKRIAPLAFYKCLKLKDISIPSSVENIGQMAFKHCIALETFKMPNSVKAMGTRVFESSYRLKSIVLSENLKEIPEHTFWGCKALETIEIPKSVKYIGSEAFRDCVNLTKVKLYSSTEVSSSAFKNCPKVVIEKYDEPKTVEAGSSEKQTPNIDKKNYQRQVGKFLSILYREYILVDKDGGNEIVSTMCTSTMKEMMKKACPGNDCFSVAPFRNGYQDGETNNSELKAVYTTKNDTWYIVDYVYKGRDLRTYIEVLALDNKMWLNRVSTQLPQ